MTQDARLAVAQAFNRLAVAHPARFRDDDHQGSQYRAALEVYWDALSDLPPAAVVQAGRALERSSSFFPSPKEWREKALREKFALTVKALPENTGGSVACDDCQDTGFQVFTCAAGARCGRRRCLEALEDYSHTYAVPCGCREQNPAYQRDRAAMFGAVPFDARMAAAGKDE